MSTVAHGRRRQNRIASDPEIVPAPQPGAPTGSSPTTEKRFWIVWGLIFVSPAPLVAIHLSNLWQQPRYQFYPLFLLIVALVARSRWNAALAVTHQPQPDTKCGWSGRLQTPLLVISLTILMGAVLFGSPWMGMVAFLMSLTSWALSVQRQNPQCGLLAMISALWILVPPPFNADIRLVQFLQRMTAKLSSRVLDLLEYNHLLEGTVIQFTNRQVLVEEACSGVQSFFALVAVSILYGLWKGRLLWHTLALVAASGVWSLLGNVLRILAITLLDPVTRIDLSSGWGHELLGLGAFVVSCVMLVSFDHLLQFIADPIVGIDGEPTPLSLAWNRWGAGVPSSDELELDTEITKVSAPSESSIPDTIPRPVPVLCAGLFAILLGLQIVAFTRSATARQWHPDTAQQGLRLTRGALPTTLGTWKLESFEVQRHEDGRSQGNISRLWHYRGHSYDATIALDYPFIDSHNLTTCYVNRGWTLTDQTTHRRPQTAESGPYVEVRFRRSTGEAGYLMFALFDEHGTPLPAPASDHDYVRRFHDRIASSPVGDYLVGQRTMGDMMSRNVYQLQIFIATSVDLTQRQRQQLHQQFEDVRQRVLGLWKITETGT